MSFGKFVDENDACSVCRYYNSHPDVRSDIEGELAGRLSDKPPTQYATLISKYLYAQHSEDISADAIRAHYRRNHHKGDAWLASKSS